MTEEEIERMLKDASKNLCDSKPVGLKRLGIDEIALIKEKGNYCAVLVNLDTSKPIAILKGRTKEIIKQTLVSWGSDVLEQIIEVSIELGQGYKTVINDLIPKAQVVADIFHVMAIINQELDTQRKSEKFQIIGFTKSRKTSIKKSRT